MEVMVKIIYDPRRGQAIRDSEFLTLPLQKWANGQKVWTVASVEVFTAVQRLVKYGLLAHDDVTLHVKYDGAKPLHIRLNKEGNFIDHYPDSPGYELSFGRGEYDHSALVWPESLPHGGML